MANNPKSRHGKSTRKPVTLDLEAEKKETAGKDAGPTGKVPEPEPVAMEQSSAKKEPAYSKADNSGPDRTAQGAVEGSGASRSNAARTQDTAKTQTGPSETSSKREPAGSGESARASTTGAAGGSTASARTSRGGSRTAAVSAGVTGGVIALVLAAVLQWAGLLPAPGPGVDLDPVQQRLDELSGDINTLRDTPPAGTPEELQAQIDSASSAASSSQQALEALRSEVQAINQQVADLSDAVSSGSAGESAGLETLSERTGNLESTVSTLSEQINASDGEATAQVNQAVEDLSGQVTELRQTVDSLSGSMDERFSSLDQRLGDVSSTVEAMQQRVAGIEEAVDSGAGSRVAQAIAASGLKNAVDRGGAFMNELEAYAAVGGAQEDIEALREYAASGVPTLAQLNDRYPQVANRIVSAGAGVSGDAGFGDRLLASARSLVNVRPVGEVEGDTPGAIAARMEVALQDGDLQRFMSEWEALPQAAQEASGDFAADVRARMRVDNLIDDVLTGAMQNAAPAEGE